MSITIMDDLKVLGEQLERLQIENRLLRAASEEQRKLNGILRFKYNLYNVFDKESFDLLNKWTTWFDTWAIMLDGSCYDDAYDYYCQSRDLSETIKSFPKEDVKTNAVNTTTEEWDCQP